MKWNQCLFGEKTKKRQINVHLTAFELNAVPGYFKADVEYTKEKMETRTYVIDKIEGS